MKRDHVPVLTDAVVRELEIIPGEKYIDATLGAGGHTEEIAKRGGLVLGIDQDQTALGIAKKNLEGYTGITFAQGNFRFLEEIAQKHGFGSVRGVLFDLGVSSMQLDTPDRGFSFRFTDAPLDMRMDTSGGDTAAQLVNRETREELYDIISKFGEEQLADEFSDALVRARAIKPINTVGDLMGIINNLVPGERERIPVSARIFQALRIAVNDELTSLKLGLLGAEHVLKPDGKLVVISFHSLEDRIVKLFFRGSHWKKSTKPHYPTETDIDENRRARSAKLRTATKII